MWLWEIPDYRRVIMRRELLSLISLTLMLSIASTSSAVIIGNFENGSMDGWELSWEGDSILAISDIGATSGSGSLSVSAPPNKFSWTILKNMDPAVLGIESNIIVSMDVTWVASEWAPQQGMWLNLNLLAVNSDGPSGWQQVGPYDPVNPDWPSGWDPSWGDQTRTLSYDLSSYDATGATWLQVVLSMTSGDVTTAGKYYIDNISITDTSAPVVVADPVFFADAKLKALVEAELGVSNPTQTDMLTLTGTLEAQDKGITDLTGLEYATNLASLWIFDNQITDLSPLADLTKLIHLYPARNQIRDISPLAKLTQLTILGLEDNQITDISPLAGLTSLSNLGLGKNQISDISPLTGLTNLEKLHLNENQISDISPLAGLVKLTELDLFSNQINNLSALKELTNVTFLVISRNQIDDIGPLANLANLEILGGTDNLIRDIGPLAGLANLWNLQLGMNQISDISPLADLTNLEFLILYDNQISDLAPVAGMTRLQKLRVHKTVSWMSHPSVDCPASQKCC